MDSLLLLQDASTADPAISFTLSQAEIRERVGKLQTAGCHEQVVPVLDLNRAAWSCCPLALSSEHKDNQ